MSDDALNRIAAALERLSPPPASAADLSAHPAYHWNGKAIAEVGHFAPLPLSLIVGVDRQRDSALENIRRHAQGFAAHDMLLWGARGMGKSALVKSVLGHLQGDSMDIALIEASAAHSDSLPALFAQLGDQPRRYMLFIDDIAFDTDHHAARMLRSVLEGGAEARPDNIRLAVTSNRRNIVARHFGAEDDAINARDEADDSLALADRFGMKLGFQYPDQAGFLAMVAAYATHYTLDWAERDALAFAHQRGGRSGRIAWHYVVELAGAAGRRI